MNDVALAAVAAGAAALLVVLAARPILRRLPEPPEGEDKPLYRDLGTPAFLVACGTCAAAGAALTWLLLPLALQPLWAVLSVLGVLLTVIDARTTWLPLLLTRVAWAAMALAILAGALLATDWWLLARAAAGAGIAGVLYFIIWYLARGGFGFGDVRFAPLIGAATAAGSWPLLVWSLLLGSVIGAALGVIRLALRRREVFPYAPPMLAGAYAACLLTAALP